MYKKILVRPISERPFLLRFKRVEKFGYPLNVEYPIYNSPRRISGVTQCDSIRPNEHPVLVKASVDNKLSFGYQYKMFDYNIVD